MLTITVEQVANHGDACGSVIIKARELFGSGPIEINAKNVELAANHHMDLWYVARALREIHLLPIERPRSGRAGAWKTKHNQLFSDLEWEIRIVDRNTFYFDAAAYALLEYCEAVEQFLEDQKGGT